MTHITIILMVALMLLSSCLPLPWKVWRYEPTVEFNGFPLPTNLPEEEKYPEFYIDGAFVHVLVIAHNQTTTSGSSPYRVIAQATTPNKEHKQVIFHSLQISDSEGKNYLTQPITVNKLAQKNGVLSFPVAKDFVPFDYRNPTPEIKKYTHASMWTDCDIDLRTKIGIKVRIEVEVEVKRSNSSEKKVIIYEFLPRKESGLFQYITA